MEARIYRPAKTAMQSGQARTKAWRLDYVLETPKPLDALMGWAGSGDPNEQVSVSFESRDAAIAFCRKRGIAYRLVEPHDRKLHIKTYADNFGSDRIR